MECIKQYIVENKNHTSYLDIYNNLKNTYNQNYVKFALLVYFYCDVDEEIRKDYELKEKRKYQHLLRKQVLEKFKHKCVISGNQEEIVLEVAHIKPVSECLKNEDKLNVSNTLLLWNDVHKFFDLHLISVNPETSNVETEYEYLIKYNKKHLDLDCETKEYLKDHYMKYKNKK